MSAVFSTVQTILDQIAAQPGLDPALADVLDRSKAKQDVRRFSAEPVRHSAFADFEEDDDLICTYCNGSGQGMHEGTTCRSCGGRGVEKHRPLSGDDFEEIGREMDEDDRRAGL